MQANVNGTTMPVLEMSLDTGEEIVSTHGDLSWMSPTIQMSQRVGSGGGGLLGGLKRMAGGGGLVLTHYQAASGPGMVAFAAKLPGRIFDIEVGPGHGYLVHRHGWLCGTTGIVPTVGLQQTFRGGLWGGEGFILQKLEGEGKAWIELSGEILSYELAAGQTLLVHPGHVGLFTDQTTFQVIRIPGIQNWMFGGDGHHLVQLTGPGTVWLQSMPIPILAGALAPYLGGGDRSGMGTDAASAGVGGVIGGILGRNI